jgi:hypothetical protein
MVSPHSEPKELLQRKLLAEARSANAPLATTSTTSNRVVKASHHVSSKENSPIRAATIQREGSSTKGISSNSKGETISRQSSTNTLSPHGRRGNGVVPEVAVPTKKEHLASTGEFDCSFIEKFRELTR